MAMISKVEVEYHSGLSVSSRKLLRPLMRMFTAYAGKVKYRIMVQHRLADGRQAGRYTPVKATEKQARKELAVAMNMKNAQKIAQWQSTLHQIGLNRGGRPRGYRDSGGMWRGLKVKAQQSGKTITMGFLGKSRARPGSGKKVETNKRKAWFALVQNGRHREGIHLFTPTKAEFDTLKAHYALNVVPGMLKEVKERQKVAALIKKAVKQDAKLKGVLDQYLKL